MAGMATTVWVTGCCSSNHLILSVAMRLFKEQGVNATSMEQIAQEVDIAEGTLYNYFPALMG